MAFVNRTTRDNNRVGFPSKAGGDLGPGSYNLSSGLRTSKPAFTAFGSTTGRSNLGAAGSGVAFVTPGPGTYGVPGVRPIRIEAEKSNIFRSKTQRFKASKVQAAPGPGAYSIKSSFKVSRKKRLPQPSNSSSSNNARGGRGGQNNGIVGSSAPVTWVRVASAPSIPAPSQSYGYEEGQYGELIMQKPPISKPAAYQVRTELGGTNVRSVDWARSQTTRTDFTKNTGDAPGPGQYQTTAPQTENMLETMEPKLTSSFASKSSRLKQPSKSRHKKNNQAPGPGQYRVSSFFVVSSFLRLFVSSSLVCTL